METIKTWLGMKLAWIMIHVWVLQSRMEKFLSKHPTVKHGVEWLLSKLYSFACGIRWVGYFLFGKRRSPSIVIAICGKKGSGKDTSCSLIRKHMWHINSSWYKHKAFARPLKDVVKVLTGCGDKTLETHEGKESVFDNPYSSEPETYRDILKAVGKATRKYLANWIHSLWVNDVLQYAEWNLPLYWILSDLRLPDELKWLRTHVARDARVFVIRVQTPFVDEDKHVTEVSVDEFPSNEIDFTIYNIRWDDKQQTLDKECKRICEQIVYSNK